jgi:catechol 2,3-dioxygenase-like lactoylglutathione lyase family enzyme
MLKKVDRILLRVPQLEAAVKYYRDVLGMTVTRQAGNIASLKLAEQETELVLHDDPDLPAEALYYLVDDVRDIYRRREALRLKFAGPPIQVSKGFRATAKDPFGNVLLLLDRSNEASTSHTLIENAKPAGALFAGIEQKVAVKANALAEIYQNLGRTADDLPYTPHFETLYTSYASKLDEKPTRQEVWRHLLNLRKAGKLPKLGEARSRPPKVDADSEARLRELLGSDMGKRDRLPYTQHFDDLVNEFNKSQPRRLSPHLVWRIVARLAK